MKKTLVSLAMLGAFAQPAWADTSTAPNCQNPIGSWLNELGSTMTIASISGTGAITDLPWNFRTS
ncbi:exported avidin family protein [Burkholderia pseudomallei]|nr:exported avidin family protein [Burkholderia pseudomallei]